MVTAGGDRAYHFDEFALSGVSAMKAFGICISGNTDMYILKTRELALQVIDLLLDKDYHSTRVLYLCGKVTVQETTADDEWIISDLAEFRAYYSV